jgi:uncharacterized membrane protein YdjX (TVP38/TMEM64 family)
MTVLMSEHPSSEERAPVKEAEKKDEGRKAVLKAILLALLLAGSLALVHLSPVGYYINTSHIDALKDRLFEFHAWTPVVFFLGGAVVIAIGAPRSIISILGGMVFGFLEGTLLSLGAALLGSAVIFFLTKWLGRPLFRQKLGGYLKTIEGHARKNGFWIVVLLRQLPLTCILVNVLIGLTSVSARAFFWGSIVGLLPEAAIFSLFGSSVREAFVLRISIASFLLVLLALAIRMYYRSSKLAQKLSRERMN